MSCVKTSNMHFFRFVRWMGVLKWLKGSLDGHDYIVVSHFESNTCHRMKHAINQSFEWTSVFVYFPIFFTSFFGISWTQHNAHSVYHIISSASTSTSSSLRHRRCHPHFFEWRQRVKHFHPSNQPLKKQLRNLMLFSIHYYCYYI